MATFYSAAKRATHWKFFAVIFILTAGIAVAEDSQQKKFAGRAAAAFLQAQKQFQSENNSSNAVQFARACYDLADFATDAGQRASLANQGIDVCRKLISPDSKNAAAHYYLAMNLGQLARTKSLGALKIVKEMEAEFQTALDLDGRVDFGGPARSLGMLYCDAPGWPVSIGSKRKAKIYLGQSLKIAPDFPENLLVAIESDLKWRDTEDAKNKLDALDALWSNAQKKFAGENWGHDWADWTNRRDDARRKLAEISVPTKSPRNDR
jgi:hypothetical protein